jgi:curved DNA-binding protein CbpA
MSSPNNLEIQGSLHEHPLAELLVEAAAARLSGSFRLVSHAQKAMIYLRGGEIVFAASNAREHRLFQMLLASGKLRAAQINAIPNFANDQTLGDALLAQQLISPFDAHRIFTRQVEEIVKSAITWTEGEWTFSALVRIKESINYKIETRKILFEYARSLSPDKIVRRFRSFQETFGLNPTPDALQLQLATQEAFLLSRFEKSFLKIQEIVTLGGLPEAMTMQTLYVLWLGGFLYRQNWNAAFSERKISAMLSAKLALNSDEIAAAADEAEAAAEAAVVAEEAPRRFQPIKAEIVRRNGKKEETKTPAPEAAKPFDPEDERRRTEAYLKRVEDAVTLYQVLGVAPSVKTAEIKAAYFALAKRFHPDLFHKEAGTETHRRIQVAFTEIAHAYEILKEESSREIYDFKNREKISAAASGTSEPKAKAPANSAEAQAALAKESFDNGYSYLMDGEYEEALPLLARAVHLAPANARYHIFYGKVLSTDEKATHKAESEMQTAIKLDPNNSVFRLMLAEFYIEVRLYRRAEGELQRLLAMFPNNKEAQDLLDSLPKK